MPSRRSAPGGNSPPSCKYLCTASRPVNSTPEIKTSSPTFSARIFSSVNGGLNFVMTRIAIQTGAKVQPTGADGTRTSDWAFELHSGPLRERLCVTALLQSCAHCRIKNTGFRSNGSVLAAPENVPLFRERLDAYYTTKIDQKWSEFSFFTNLHARIR